MKKSISRGIKIIVGIIIVFLVLVIGMVAYLLHFYHANGENPYLKGNRTIHVEKMQYGYIFDHPDSRCALIFYPGAKVEYTAYAPLMYEIAERGVDCYLVEMPWNMAFFDMDRADAIIEEFGENEDVWYIGGHSLGGAMADSYMNSHKDKVAGLVLCGAYLSNDYSQDDLGILSLYGSEDKVLSRDKYEKGLAYVSQRFEEYVIEGGNHAWFGNYGEQSGDGTATISHKRQWYYAGDKIARFVKNE